MALRTQSADQYLNRSDGESFKRFPQAEFKKEKKPSDTSSRRAISIKLNRKKFIED